MTVFNSKFTSLTLVAAVVAAIAATATAGLGWPVWAMFIGWVGFFTGAPTIKGALCSYICVAAGLAFGNFAVIGVDALLPLIDYLAFGICVFGVALVVVSLRAAPLFNNVPAYFLGLIAFFAAHVPPGVLAFGELAAIAATGFAAALVAHGFQMKLHHA